MEASFHDKAEPLASELPSRATSPGRGWQQATSGKVVEVTAVSTSTTPGMHDAMEIEQSVTKLPTRYRPRTFPYQAYLPYSHDDRELVSLAEITKRLYIAVSAGDFVPGATHWTRELRGWIQLKFDLPREDRIRLAKLYYELALAPGLDTTPSERFTSMFITLTKRKHYLRAGEDLTLDWRPLYRELKSIVLPDRAGGVVAATPHHRRSPRTLQRLAAHARLFFNPEEVKNMFTEIVPYYSTSNPEHAFAVIGLLNVLLPASACSVTSEWQLQHYLPTLFHVCSLLNRSKAVDIHFIDLLSRAARDNLHNNNLSFSEYGLFTHEQTSMLYTLILRLLEIPVGQVNSPYTSNVDLLTGLATVLEQDQRKYHVSRHIARWIVFSLSPACLDKTDSMFSKLESLIEAVETFFHPSNTGSWTKTLAHLVFYLCDFFTMRWNRERSGEMDVQEDRKLTDAVKRRFVLCLREVTFMGMFAKSSSAMNHSLSALQCLAYLEPTLILPRALQRIYPAMRGLTEVHRTTSCIRAMHELTRTLIKTKGFRCHVTSLLGLALPGIDANDLDKTIYTLSFMQAVFYQVPMWTLGNGSSTEESPSDSHTTGTLAAEWVTTQIDRLENEGVNVEIDYDSELSDDDEVAILRSSTADLQQFISSFLERIFNLLRNLPDAARIKSGSPEENVANALPAIFTPMLSCMSPEIYDMTLKKIADFVSQNTVYQARDATSFICSSLCKANPKKALSLLVPLLIRGIRSEIDDNAAGSSRTTGSEVLPRDKALVWNISLLSVSVVHVGNAVLDFQDDLLDIARYMREKCKGIPSTHASNFIHHLLLTLTTTYTVDTALFEGSTMEHGIDASHWGPTTDPYKLSIKWHYPDDSELKLALKLFKSFAQEEMSQLRRLIGDSSPIKRDGSGKDWSDEVSRSLTLLRMIVSGISSLFDPNRQNQGHSLNTVNGDMMDAQDAEEFEDDDSDDDDDTDPAGDDDDVRPTFKYATGYPMAPSDPIYQELHDIRAEIGTVLHSMHEFLTKFQQDDVTSFNSLYVAYKSWFVDVGMERSAHVLDRETKLFDNDIVHFKISGLRKEYPRPLLVRRAKLYHVQRVRHNASPRFKTEQDVLLLNDLVESSVSYYTEIRKGAQSAGESSLKVLIGVRPILIPQLLNHWETAIKENDHQRMKGAMYSLLLSSLGRTVGRDWRFAPRLIKCYVDVMDVDKLSVQKLATACTLQVIDMTRPNTRMVILDQAVVEQVLPTQVELKERLREQIQKKNKSVNEKREFAEREKKATGEKLAEIIRTSHWRKENRTATLLIGLSFRFDDIASSTAIDLVVRKSIDGHPSLRTMYGQSLIALFAYIDMRALYDHSYEKLLLDQKKLAGYTELEPATERPDWTAEYLAMFSKPEARTFVDQDWPGWLAWGQTFPAWEASAGKTLQYDETETKVRQQIGRLLDRDWFKAFFDYMKQEPRDQAHDRFRMMVVTTLGSLFGLVFAGTTPTSFEDLKELTGTIYGDGSDKHQHRATAEILAGLLTAADHLEGSKKSDIWSYAFPIVRSIFEDGITPENSSYWTTFLDYTLQNEDPRRNWPLVDWLASFRLNMSSNAAFKESSKITLLEHCIYNLGWHFQLEAPILENFMTHLDHPYKGVRGVMGKTIACIYRTRYHESHSSVDALVAHEKAASSVGSRPYQPTAEFSKTIRETFENIEKWRLQRTPGQQTASSYTSGSKTVLSWLESTLNSFECTSLTQFFPGSFLESILQMMDIKEDPELQSQAYSVFRHLGNIPYRMGEEQSFVEALIKVGKEATSWHQRLRILINIQAIYFRHLFLMPRDRQESLFQCVSEMLQDSQLEVRQGAATTLSGMIRCSPVGLRESVIKKLTNDYNQLLAKNQLPKHRGTGTPTPEHSKIILRRHAAVLGLGALVQAFPYSSPPPLWIPSVLATLATKAAGDPGIVGKSAKSIVSDFKKTRQDTWHIDLKAFKQEQLEDLEGVLWKSYFA